MTTTQQYYKEHLGPVAHYFAHKVSEYIEFFNGHNTPVLYCARAGYTINQLVKQLPINERHTQIRQSVFWVSRFILSKSFFLQGNSLALECLLAEHRHSSAEVLLNGLLPNRDNAIEIAELRGLNGEAVIDLLLKKDSRVASIRNELLEHGNRYNRYIKSLIGDNKRVLLVDSGWQGTIQDLLQSQYSDIEFHGLYFGKIGSANLPKRHWNLKHGLVFEAEKTTSFRQISIDRPSQVFALHRHIVEDMLEPNFKSIEHLVEINNELQPLNLDQITGVDEKDFSEATLGILEYVKENADLSRGEIQRLFYEACSRLRQSICHPAQVDLDHLGGLHRSFDFGKTGSMPVLFEPKDRNANDGKDRRIVESLWSHGQIALEYGVGSKTTIEKQTALQKSVEKISPSGKVAIITRTKNRPILLERAAQSVAKQTYTNFIWVVVNDGGEEEPVIDVIRRSAVDKDKVLLVSNPVSLGMEAASNRGISHCDSDYIIIHDDDDSWEAAFLEKTVGFLETPNNKVYGGVLTGTTYISEEILPNGQVKIHNSYPYNAWVRTVHLAEMVHGNFFAPIAFLFKREHYNQLGGYDERLPVLGDWDFNLRFLCKANIGVIPDTLANYHHRDVNVNPNSNYSNSVIGGISKHQEYEPIVRNKYIREELPEYRCLSTLMASGYSFNGLRHQTQNMAASAQAMAASAQAASRNSSTTTSPDLLAAVLRIPKFAKAFNERKYRADNPDVDAVIKQGKLKSGLDHYVNYGYLEGRHCPVNLDTIHELASQPTLKTLIKPYLRPVRRLIGR